MKRPAEVRAVCWVLTMSDKDWVALFGLLAIVVAPSCVLVVLSRRFGVAHVSRYIKIALSGGLFVMMLLVAVVGDYGFGDGIEIIYCAMFFGALFLASYYTKPGKSPTISWGYRVGSVLSLTLAIALLPIAAGLTLGVLFGENMLTVGGAALCAWVIGGLAAYGAVKLRARGTTNPGVPDVEPAGAKARATAFTK